MVFASSIEPTEAERAAMEALKASISSPLPAVQGPPIDDDLTLLRFVRGYAKEKDAAKAAKDAFEAMLGFREATGANERRAVMYAAKRDGEELAYPIDLPRFAALKALIGPGLPMPLGSSCEGSPTVGIQMHEYDLKKVIKADLVEQFIEFQQFTDEYWCVELAARSRSTNQMLARTIIVNVQHVGLFFFDMASIKLLPRISESMKHYPESVSRIVSCGNGKILLALYNSVIKPFVPAHTREKLFALGREQRTGCCVNFDVMASTAGGPRPASMSCICGASLSAKPGNSVDGAVALS